MEKNMVDQKPMREALGGTPSSGLLSVLRKHADQSRRLMLERGLVEVRRVWPHFVVHHVSELAWKIEKAERSGENL
jgi:hypothetical protein